VRHEIAQPHGLRAELMTSDRDMRPTSAPDGDNRYGDSPDLFPSIRTDAPLTPELSRPSVPPLRIAHVFLWTACTAAYLGIQRAWQTLAEKLVPAAGLIPEARGVSAFVFVVLPVIAGPAIATILLWPAWRARGFRFPWHPGEWLLLISGCACVLRITVVPIVSVVILTHVESLAGAFRANAIISRSDDVILLMMYSFACWRGRMGFAWRSVLLVEAIFLTLVVAFDLMGSLPLISLSGTMPWRLGVDACVVAALTVGIVSDIVAKRARPWTHWLGIATLVATRAVSGGIFLWFILV
jgi:hypothetical protein